MTPARLNVPFYAIPLGLAALLAIGYTIFWNFAANSIDKAVGNWITEQRQNGLTIDYTERHTHGFPFFLRHSIMQPEISDNTAWRWQGDQLDLDILPYDFSRIIFSLSGKQTVAVNTNGQDWTEMDASAAKLRISLGQKKTTGWFFALDTEKLKITIPDENTVLNTDAFIVNISPQAIDKSTISTSARLNNLALNTRQNGNDYTISMPLSELSANISQTDKFEQGALAWKQANGELIIDHIILTDDPSHLAIKGALSIDNAGYPTGIIESRLVKPAQFAQSIRDSGFVSAQQADAITSGLALSTLTGGGAIEQKYELRDQGVYSNGQRLGDLPQLVQQ